MLNANGLRAECARSGHTQEDVAKAIGITPATFYRKMKTGKFTLGEVDGIIEYLDIKDPAPIFLPLR